MRATRLVEMRNARAKLMGKMSLYDTKKMGD